MTTHEKTCECYAGKKFSGEDLWSRNSVNDKITLCPRHRRPTVILRFVHHNNPPLSFHALAATFPTKGLIKGGG